MTEQELKSFKQECIAEAVTEFWRQSYPVLCEMISDMLPHQMALQEYLDVHPEVAQDKGFLARVIDAKRRTPNAPLHDLLELARKEAPGG